MFAVAQVEELTPVEKKEVYVMGTRAYKKFKQLDTDSSGSLEGKEVKELAEWVWRSFHPGEVPAAEVRRGQRGEERARGRGRGRCRV